MRFSEGQLEPWPASRVLVADLRRQCYSTQANLVLTLKMPLKRRIVGISSEINTGAGVSRIIRPIGCASMLKPRDAEQYNPSTSLAPCSSSPHIPTPREWPVHERKQRTPRLPAPKECTTLDNYRPQTPHTLAHHHMSSLVIFRLMMRRFTPRKQAIHEPRTRASHEQSARPHTLPRESSNPARASSSPKIFAP